MGTIDKMILDVLGVAGKSQPAEFLAKLVAGIDPRGRTSELYNLVRGIQKTGETPSKKQWEEIVDLVCRTDDYRDAPVSLEISTKAAIQLMEYLHPKLRATDTKISGKITSQVLYRPLSPADIETFEDWFTQEI
jgi:hypothetical protein